MASYQSDLTRLVEGFVSALNELWRRQAIDSLMGGNGGGGRGRGGGGGGMPRLRGRGGKRTADEIDGLAEQIVEFVKANPGLRIEQINKQLGTTTKDLALPIRKLVSEGAVKVKGSKRATTYSITESGRRKKG
jgi:predicted transcriptional regulator